MGDTELSNSGQNLGWNNSRKQSQKVEVYNEVLSRLKELNVPEAAVPGFEDELWTHFYRLPARYAVERAQDVIVHKSLLHMAHDPATRPAVEVCLVQVRSPSGVNSSDALHSNSQRKASHQDSHITGNMSIHPAPAFGSSANFELAFEASQLKVQSNSGNPKFYTQYSREALAINVCEGTNYLHENDIIQKDLKTRNLLMDENGVVKVADFGLARVEDQSGIITAETGTYRWMAPEGRLKHELLNTNHIITKPMCSALELLSGSFSRGSCNNKRELKQLPYELLAPFSSWSGPQGFETQNFEANTSNVSRVDEPLLAPRPFFQTRILRNSGISAPFFPECWR